MQKIRKWFFTTLLAIFGGGTAGACSALFDPTKYSFPKDFGTGKLWPYFFMGAGLTLIGIILHSPFGQRIVTGIKESQAQIDASRADMQRTKDMLAGPKETGHKKPGN